MMLMASSCEKQEDFPIIPAIEMSEKQIYENPTEIIIKFTDGDGDIGLDESDTEPPYDFDTVNFNKYYYNLLMYYYEKQGDEWVYVELAVPYFYRVPNITPTGQNKTLNGEIKVNLPTLPNNRPDSVRLEIELIDRALHESNLLTTPVFTK